MQHVSEIWYVNISEPDTLQKQMQSSHFEIAISYLLIILVISQTHLQQEFIRCSCNFLWHSL